MNNLTKYDIAVISIKLLAIYITLQIIASLSSLVLTSAMIFGHDSSEYPMILKISVIALPFLSLLIPVLLWLFSNKIAESVVNIKTKVIVKYDQDQNGNDLQAILFCVVGIFILVTTLPEFFGWFYALFLVYVKSPSTINSLLEGPATIRLIIFSLKILLSILLIFSAKNLSSFFYKLRYGTQSTS